MGVVVALHDTAGLDPRGWVYAEQLTAAGIAVLHLEVEDGSIDGYGPAIAPAQPATAIARLAAAIAALAEDSHYANGPIGLLAFGPAGEAAILVATDPWYGSRIAALTLLYPGCTGLNATMEREAREPRMPIFLLNGDADPANEPAECVALAARLGQSAAVRHVQYPGAGYAWDLQPYGRYEQSKLPWPGRPGQRLTVTYWPEGTELSMAQVAGFFATSFAERRR